MLENLPQPITESDGPFSYTYLAVMDVPGIHLNQVEGDLHLFSFPDLNATARLTLDWDRYCEHIDRGSAIGILLLTGFLGRSRFKRLSSWSSILVLKLFGKAKLFEMNLAREQRNILLDRHKHQMSSGCYLVYRAEGELVEAPQFQSARRVKRIGYGFDIVDREVYRSIHKSALHGVATALSLLIDKGTGSPEIHEVADIVYLTGNDGLVVYPKRIEMGGGSVVVSRTPSKDDITELTACIPLITSDGQIEAAISLYVQSHRRDGDNLRSFIPAWSALELLVNRLAKIVRPEWEKLLLTASLPTWDKDLARVCSADYRMRDRFYSIACTLIREDASEDCKIFNQINNRRSGYYHRNDVKEMDLPTHEVRLLFRKYLSLALRYRRSDGNAT